jgi:hypothetical protein
MAEQALVDGADGYYFPGSGVIDYFYSKRRSGAVYLRFVLKWEKYSGN